MMRIIFMLKFGYKNHEIFTGGKAVQKYIIPVVILVVSIIVMNLTKPEPLNASPMDTVKNLELAFNEQNVNNFKSLLDKDFLAQQFPNGDKDIKRMLAWYAERGSLNNTDLKFDLKMVEKSNNRAIVAFSYQFKDETGGVMRTSGEFKLKQEGESWFIYDSTENRTDIGVS